MAEPFARSATGPQLQTRTRAVHRLAVSALGLFIGAGIYAWAVLTPLGQQVDASSLALGENLRAAWGEAELARAADVAPWIIIAPAVVVLAMCALRGRWRLALTTAALPVVTYAVATALHDYLLPRPYLGDFGHDINTLPSERLAVAIACCVVLASLLPAALPRAVIVPVLAIVAGGVGAIEVAAFSSRFADVVACAPLVVALAAWWLPGNAARSRRGTWARIWVSLLLVAAGAALMTAWWQSSVDPAFMPAGLWATWLCVGAGVIAASGLARTVRPPCDPVAT